MRTFLFLLTLALCAPFAAAATPVSLPRDLIELAVHTPAPRWTFVPKKRMREMRETYALQVTAVAAFQTPATVVDGKTLATHLAEKLRFFLVTPEPYPDGSTREPEAQGGLGGWTHHIPAHALLLAKRTPAVWSQLSADEHARADLLMQALALAAHFCLDDDNDYYLLLDGDTVYHKSWNPNHIEGYMGVILSASLYFGADELNAFFKGFHFDAFMARLDAANFKNIQHCWTWNPAIRGLMMNGGSIALPADQSMAAGVVTRGAGVRNSFTHDGNTLHEPWALHRAQAVRLFSKAARTRVNVHGDITTRLLNRVSSATESPWEGQMGMLDEFETTDWAGLRSSLGYAYEGAMLDIPNAVTLKLVGEWRADEGGDLLERRMGVGMADMLFKAKEGYRSWFNGRTADYGWEQDLLPMGADFVVGLWQAFFAAPPLPSKNSSPLNSASSSSLPVMSYHRAFSSLGCPEFSLEQILALAQRHHVDKAELRSVSGSVDLPAVFTAAYGSPDALAAKLKNSSIPIVSLDTSFKLVGNTAADREALLKFLPWAEALHIPWLRVFDGGSPTDPAVRQTMADTMKWWQAEKKEHGWKADLMIETHDSLFTAAAILQFLDLSPGSAILWDTHHTWKHSGEDPVITWRAIKPHVVHIHVKDSVSQPSAKHPYTYVPPGEGEFPMAPLREILRTEFTGTVSLEWEKLWHPYLIPLDDALATAAKNQWW